MTKKQRSKKKNSTNTSNEARTASRPWFLKRAIPEIRLISGLKAGVFEASRDKLAIFTGSAGETMKMGARFAKKLKKGDVVCLAGELGAGKTTFTKGLAKGLGINKMITSPTFVIMREYPLGPGRGKFCHIDLYRISENDFLTSGLDQYMNENNICVVEWPEKINGILPKNRIDIRVFTGKDNSRKFEVITHDSRD